MRVLILGANSDIGLALAHVFAGREKADLVLASRDAESLGRKARDLEIRHQVRVEALAFDALDTASHPAFYAALDPRPDVVAAAFGAPPERPGGPEGLDQIRIILDTNLLGTVSILEEAARDMAARGRGSIIGISSVAGLRGRRKNAVYGASKAGMRAYLEGLGHRLHPCGVRVLVALPGFVRTRMTEGMDLPALLTATPGEAAEDIYWAWKRGRSVVYVRWYWRWIMYAVRSLPDCIFNRLDI